MATILHIDDEPSVGLLLDDTLTRAGHRLVSARSVSEALQVLTRGSIDVLICDSRIPGLTSEELVALLEREGFDVPLIVLAAEEESELIASALDAGVSDCLTRPVRAHQLEQAVKRAVERVALRRENETLRRAVNETRNAQRIVGDSQATQRLLQLVATVGPTRTAVLIQGESGTGRKLFAKAIHDYGAHADEPLVKLNCAALPDGLIESALFGHERGAFAGAVKRVEGALERAAGGTLVLEDIQSLPPAIQDRLLRAMRSGEFTRMGGAQPIRSDVRFIATCFPSLGERVAEGRFRRELYETLSAVPVEISPLRERRDDIPALSYYFARQTAAQMEKPAPGISADALGILRNYSWPGNVRELRHAIERAVILSQDSILGAGLFDQEKGMQSSSLVQQVADRVSSMPRPALNVGLQQPMASAPPANGIVLNTLNVEEAERALIKRALEVTGGNRTRTAELLGISVRTLRNKLNGPQRIVTPR